MIVIDHGVLIDPAISSPSHANLNSVQCWCFTESDDICLCCRYGSGMKTTAIDKRLRTTIKQWEGLEEVTLELLHLRLPPPYITDYPPIVYVDNRIYSVIQGQGIFRIHNTETLLQAGVQLSVPSHELHHIICTSDDLLLLVIRDLN